MKYLNSICEIYEIHTLSIFTASLLDEMDPLSATNSTLNATTTSTNTNKQMKTPQSFLGENSSLVNLDNLIKPVQTQSQAGNAAYNPFSDTVIPPKTNLFQQQQPAVSCKRVICYIKNNETCQIFNI